MMHPPVITVFGGTGFVGRYLVRDLARTGAIIKVVSRVAARGYFLRPLGNVGQIVPIGCDVNDDASVAAAVKGSTHVVNLIGILAQKGKMTFTRLHADVPERIAKACKKEKVESFVHISAIGADKNAPSQYARSKADGEDRIKKIFPGAVILRPGLIFGPEDDFFNRFARLARFSPVLPLIGGGTTQFQPVYVCDVADAIAAALLEPEHAGGVYDLGGPQIYTFRELLEKTLIYSGQKAWFISIPWLFAYFLGFAFWLDFKVGFVSRPLLTYDQVKSLKTDNIIRTGAKTLKDLGLTPTALETVAPEYLARFRPGGCFAKKRAE